MKVCTKCRELKKESEFNKKRAAKDGLRSQCKECRKERRILNRDNKRMYDKKYQQLNQDKIRKLHQLHRVERNKKSREYHYARDVLPMSKNKECPCYLGVYIAEELVAKYFKDPIRMPAGNPGYDFICNKEYKIDVKSSVLTKENRWCFEIKKNKIADYFLCIAYDNRSDLNLLHVWLFPGHVVNNAKRISSTPSKISKWSQYEKPIDDMKVCCETLKETMI